MSLSGIGAGSWSRSEVTASSQRPSSAACSSLIASTSSSVGSADGSRPCSSRLRHGLDAQPHRSEQIGGPEAAAPKPRVVDEDQVPQRLHSRPLVVHALVLDAGRLPHARHGRRPVGAQPQPPLAQVGQVVRADQGRGPGDDGRARPRRNSMTSTPFTTRLVTSPSITAPCMTTPIRRVLFRLHSRNSAPSMSSSTYRVMLNRLCPPAAAHRQTAHASAA